MWSRASQLWVWGAGATLSSRHSEPGSPELLRLPGTLQLRPPTRLEALCKHGAAAAVIKAAFERTQGSSASDPPTLAPPISLNWIIYVYLLILHICHQGRVE